MTALLEISGLRKQFGGVVAVADIDLSITTDTILGVVGPNGSGKTTLFNVVTGVHKPTAGRVEWKGVDITGYSVNQVARSGIAHTFQQAMAFPGLSVLENVTIAAEHGADEASRSARNWRTPLDIVGFVGLRPVAHEKAGILPFGALRRLGLAVALAIRPSLILLDEPAAGLNDRETAELEDLVAELPRLGIGICVIDHDMNLMASLCDRIAVLNFGTKIAEGTPEEVLHDPQVLEVYLGGEL